MNKGEQKGISLLLGKLSSILFHGKKRGWLSLLFAMLLNDSLRKLPLY